MAGIASGISSLAVGSDDGRRRQSKAKSAPNNPATNPGTKASPSPSEKQVYSNVAEANIKGLSNQTGRVKGDANGAINLGSLSFAPQSPAERNDESSNNVADLPQKVDALKGLVGVVKKIGEDEPQNKTPPNTGGRNIMGLSNQTGFIEGNANGVINLGSLNVKSLQSEKK